MEHLQTHKGRLFYRRRVPGTLQPAFAGKTVWRKTLGLSADEPQSEIATKWAELHEDFENLVALARNANTEVLNAVDLSRATFGDHYYASYEYAEETEKPKRTKSRRSRA